MKPVLSIIISILLGSFGQLALKYGAKLAAVKAITNGTLSSYLLNPPIWCGLLLYGLSAILWIYSLTRTDLSYAYPMVALGYVFVCVFSVLLFKEAMPYLRIAGLCVIILGVLMVAKSA